MKLNRYRVYCEGKGPGLFMDCMSEETLEGIRTKEKAAPKLGGSTRREEAAAKLYRDPSDPSGKGAIGIPATMLFACLRWGGKYVKYPKLGARATVSTKDTTQLPVFLTIEDPFLPLHLEDENGQKISTDWERAWYDDLRRGNNNSGTTKIAVAVVRPCFRKWGFQVHIEVDADEMHPESVKTLFVEAGRRAGLGGNRPNTGGPFGQFSVKKFELLGTEEEETQTQPASATGDGKVSRTKARELVAV